MTIKFDRTFQRQMIELIDIELRRLNPQYKATVWFPRNGNQTIYGDGNSSLLRINFTHSELRAKQNRGTNNKTHGTFTVCQMRDGTAQCFIEVSDRHNDSLANLVCTLLHELRHFEQYLKLGYDRVFNAVDDAIETDAENFAQQKCRDIFG